MMEWLKAQMGMFEDPFTLVILAPIVLGALYLIVSFFGERGE